MNIDFEYLNKVKEFSFDQHARKNQLYAGFPYSKHLIDVEAIGEKFIEEIKDVTKRIYVLGACYGHDLIEDIPLSFKKTKQVFGEFTADVIFDVSNELAKTKKEKSLKTYPKTAKNEYAIYVKCCDRLANTTFSKTQGSKEKYEGYVEDYPYFRSVLKQGNMYPKLWKALDEVNNFSL